MDNKKQDLTIKRNYTNKWRFLFSEYSLIKQRKHKYFSTIIALCKSHDIPRQTFYKYYNRYKNSKNSEALLPQKRGPRWSTRRPDLYIEQQVIVERGKGLNKYEIYQILLPKLGRETPSPFGIYNILKRYKMNRLKEPQKEEKRRIIKERAGQLGHVDCHYLSKDLITDNRKILPTLCNR